MSSYLLLLGVGISGFGVLANGTGCYCSLSFPDYSSACEFLFNFISTSTNYGGSVFLRHATTVLSTVRSNVSGS